MIARRLFYFTVAANAPPTIAFCLLLCLHVLSTLVSKRFLTGGSSIIIIIIIIIDRRLSFNACSNEEQLGHVLDIQSSNLIICSTHITGAINRSDTQ